MGVLAVLGLSTVEEQVYEALASVVSSTSAELSAVTGLSVRTVGRAVDGLAARGLVLPLVGEDNRVTAAPHEAALDALVHEHQQSLAHVRVHGQRLAERARAMAERRRPDELVSVVSGSGPVNAQFEQLQRMARHEVLVFDRPPYPVTGGTGTNPIAAERIASGVTYRTLYDRSLLEHAETLARVRRDLASGERGRVLENVPLKLAIADRSLALLPLLEADETTDQAALVIQPSVLLDSLATLFEALWDHAVPLASTATPEERGDDRELREVVELMAAGLTDESIARHLGVSERTVRRKVAAALDVLGAETRFQAGARAQELGWLAR